MSLSDYAIVVIIFARVYNVLGHACPPKTWLCGDQLKCIPQSWVLDDIADCTDGSDELLSTLELLKSADGHHRPNATVSDMTRHDDELAGAEPVLYLTTGDDIGTYGLTSKKRVAQLIPAGFASVHRLTVDPVDGFLYWTGKYEGRTGLFRTGMDASLLSVSSVAANPEGLAIDWLGRNVYYVDYGLQLISVCRTDGAFCSHVIRGRLDRPRDVALEPISRQMFWTDWGRRMPHIGSAGMDGSRRRFLVHRNIVYPNGLVVSSGRVYWCDAGLDRIESIRTDGGDRRKLPVAAYHPYGIDVLDQLIYWVDPIYNGIMACDKRNGSGLHQVLVDPAITLYTGIHIHDLSKQLPDVENPCAEAGCSHLCLLSPEDVGYKCTCPSGIRLDAGKRDC